MGLRIELEQIWKRLQTRFKARRKTDTDPEDPAHPILIETVQPITDADELLKEYDVEEFAIARLAATGAGLQLVAEVPEGKRWHVFGITILRLTGDGTMTTLWIRGTGDHQIVTQGAAQGVATNMMPQVAVMDEGMNVSFYCDAITGDSTWAGRVYRAEEDAF